MDGICLLVGLCFWFKRLNIHFFKECTIHFLVLLNEKTLLPFLYVICCIWNSIILIDFAFFLMALCPHVESIGYCAIVAFELICLSCFWLFLIDWCVFLSLSKTSLGLGHCEVFCHWAVSYKLCIPLWKIFVNWFRCFSISQIKWFPIFR